MKKKIILTALFCLGVSACETTGELKAPCSPIASLSATETGCDRQPINTQTLASISKRQEV